MYRTKCDLYSIKILIKNGGKEMLKKKFLLGFLMLVCMFSMMFTSMLSASAALEDAVVELVVDENFEGYNVGDTVPGWTGVSTIQQAADVTNSSKYIEGTDWNWPAGAISFSPIRGRIIIEFSIRGGITSNTRVMNIFQGTNNLGGQDFIRAVGGPSNLRFFGTTVFSQGLLANTWYSVRLEIDTAKETDNVTGYVIGQENLKKTVTVADFYGASIDKIAFSDVAFDNVKVSYVSYLEH